MILLDGKKVSQDIKDNLKQEVIEITKNNERAPHLTIVLVGDVMASKIYVKNKIKACEYTGIKSTLIKKEETIQTEELVALIEKLNNDDSVDGIIVQLPLPKHIDEQLIINTISHKKDVDGFGIENKGRLFSGLLSY